MDLKTTYMGLELKNPIIVGSSKLTSTVENIKKCADQGAGAVVLKSLFEEQLLTDESRLMDQDAKYFWFPEAVEFINDRSKGYGLNEYVKLIEEAKKTIDIPVIASINCVTANEWPKFAKGLEDAGADAIELNISIFPFSADIDSNTIEDLYVDIVTEVKKYVSIPVSVKLGPCFTNVFQIVKRIEDAGANAVVLFNRFYRPDINIENGTVVRDNFLSAPAEITQALRWVSVMSTNTESDICGNTGIHDYTGVIKHLMAGADAVQVCSALYNNGIGYIDTILFELNKWLDGKGYNSIEDIKGVVVKDEENTAAFQRVQFMRRTVE